MGRHGVPWSLDAPFGMLVDLAGDDVYDGMREPIAIACGLFGVGAIQMAKDPAGILSFLGTQRLRKRRQKAARLAAATAVIFFAIAIACSARSQAQRCPASRAAPSAMPIGFIGMPTPPGC